MLTRQDDRLYGLRRLSSEIQVGLKLVVAVRSIHRVILYLDPTGLLAPPGGVMARQVTLALLTATAATKEQARSPSTAVMRQARGVPESLMTLMP